MTKSSRRTFLKHSAVLLSSVFAPQLACSKPAPTKKPNIILFFIDDMGWGDFSCFGNTKAQTPNFDRVASEGIRFEQFYVNSPICSPSRTAISTGMYPQRYRISSYLAHRKDNLERGIANWLDPKAPMLARFLHQSGYATGHFGKWHMGGQRDVTDAYPITDYGFDESLTNFEGLGPKLLPMTEVPADDGGVKKGRIWQDATILGEPVTWMLRSEITSGFINRAMKFIDKAQAKNQPFYINLWPDDVHSPFFPSVKNWKKEKGARYRSVLKEMDAQFTALFDRINNDAELRDNTLIVICSDNGPEPGAGSPGPFRGSKATLFEGGVRSPLVVWGPGFIDKKKNGSTNSTSVFSAIDLVPSLLDFAGVSAPDEIDFDGENLSQTLLGKSDASRKKPIFFRRPPDREEYRDYKNLPDLSVREAKWKLLCDYGGINAQLYNLEDDPGEKINLAEQNPKVTKRLVEAILKWNETLPKDAGDPHYQ